MSRCEKWKPPGAFDATSGATVHPKLLVPLIVLFGIAAVLAAGWAFFAAVARLRRRRSTTCLPARQARQVTVLVLLDTNAILDVALRRPGLFEGSRRALEKCETESRGSEHAFSWLRGFLLHL